MEEKLRRGISAAGSQASSPAAPPERRTRRVIWNNDGNDLWRVAHQSEEANGPLPYASADEFLGTRMKGRLEGTHVDSLSYNGHTNEPEWQLPARSREVLGPNPLIHVVDYAHQNGMELMYSIRMNDLHCAVLPGIHRWSPEPKRSGDCARLGSRRCRTDSRGSWRPTPSCAPTTLTWLRRWV